MAKKVKKSSLKLARAKKAAESKPVHISQAGAVSYILLTSHWLSLYRLQQKLKNPVDFNNPRLKELLDEAAGQLRREIAGIAGVFVSADQLRTMEAEDLMLREAETLNIYFADMVKGNGVARPPKNLGNAGVGLIRDLYAARKDYKHGFFRYAANRFLNNTVSEDLFPDFLMGTVGQAMRDFLRPINCNEVIVDTVASYADSLPLLFIEEYSVIEDSLERIGIEFAEKDVDIIDDATKPNYFNSVEDADITRRAAEALLQQLIQGEMFIHSPATEVIGVIESAVELYIKAVIDIANDANDKLAAFAKEEAKEA